MNKKFPSLDQHHLYPHGWIQWKGTNVCMDFRCECGESTHFDGVCAYHLKCGKCGKVYECDGHIKLHLLNFEPENTQETTE